MISAMRFLVLLLSAPLSAVAIGATIPLTANDPAFFTGNTAFTGEQTLPANTTFYKRSGSIGHVNNIAVIWCQDSCTLSNVSAQGSEVLRVTGGVVHVDRSYLEVNSTIADDHPDTVQMYSPGDSGMFIATNSYIHQPTSGVLHTNVWVADNWEGTVILNNVAFRGGLYGIRIHADNGPDNIQLYMKDVCFVGYSGNQMDLLDYGGGIVYVRQWDNVRNCTISGGELIPGTTLSCSSFSSHCPTGTELSVPSGVSVQ